MELILPLLFFLTVNLASSTVNEEKTLSRQKRYVVFPEGSQFSFAFCLSFKTFTDDDLYTGGLEILLAYNLPNDTDTYKEHGFFFEPIPVKMRRHRRDLYRHLEVAFNSAGVDGRSCMLRTLCEAAQRLIPRRSIISEFFRILFTLPLERVRHHEPAEHHIYDAAHRSGLADENCGLIFPSCPASLLDLALGPRDYDFKFSH